MKATQRNLNPFKNTDSNKRYYTMDYYMRRVFGKKACKVPIDAGFTCPNRDGTKGVGGCTFCSESGSGEFTAGREFSITEQIDIGAKMMRDKWQNAVLIPYFQAYTGTYAPLDVLKARFLEALSHPLASGICIATRPDCVTEEIADYLKELAREHFVMVELGLQTTFDSTAKLINRCYGFDEFLKAYSLLDGIFVCIHLINGLPGETEEMMLENARTVASLNPKAVKIHLLHVIKGTAIAKDYLDGKLPVMSLEAYVNTVCSQLELLPPDTVIERVTGDGAKASLLAPAWSLKKLVVQNEIDKLLYAKNSFQGKYYKQPLPSEATEDSSRD